MIVGLGEEILSWDRRLLRWEDLCDALTEVMQELNPGGEWHVKVVHFGWRGLNGDKKTFHADTGKELLEMILPTNTDCTFDIYRQGEGLAINNRRHDSPTGQEWYYIEPLEQTEGETL